MKKVLLSVILGFVFGLPAIFVFILAGEALEVHGTSSVRELVAGCLGVALYLAYCEFWVAPRGARGFGAKVPTLAATIMPLLMTLALFDRRAILDTWIPMAASGLLGGLAGAVVAERAFPRHSGASQGASAHGPAAWCRRMVLAGAALLVAVALVVALVVIPPVRADISNFATPQKAAEGFWVIAALNLLAAAPLAFAALAPHGLGRNSALILAFPAVLMLLVGVTILAPAIDFLAHGPAMRTAAAVLFLCAALNLAASALVTASSVIADRALSPADPAGLNG